VIGFSAIAAEAGSKLYANSVAAGFITALFGTDSALLERYMRRRFSSKSAEVVENNVAAAARGAEEAARLGDTLSLSVSRARQTEREDRILNGAQAVALGAVAGGCNFVSSYPMSPSTGVLVSMARDSHDAGVVVEQAEDEIAAINMALGAWYAGARALVTTSGGGFALMCEGMSLAGMIETPVVVHIGQRPGPATGLPTRTEQGDLELALHAGHGEYPRIIFAPGTLEQAFRLTQQAFNAADRYQVPVIILTDQYLLDSYFQVSGFDLDGLEVRRHIVETDASYRRYRLTDSGISPRGVPGWGSGLVCVDSDEHTEEGFITESMQVRTDMVDKRLRKLDALQRECMEPEYVGEPHAPNLVVCWGSTYHVVKETLERLGRSDTAMLHFSQVYPLPDTAAGILGKAQRRIIVENNATAQFARLLKIRYGTEFDHRLLQCNGLPFSTEEVGNQLTSFLDKR
jgi:2-oxoglutarate ferredoxin oxidoreductase subunit alpha